MTSKTVPNTILLLKTVITLAEHYKLISKTNQLIMLKKGEHIEGTPAELQNLIDKDPKAKAFFDSLAKSYKQGYCDWVGSAKQETTRITRAEKALKMLQNEQKTLKT